MAELEVCAEYGIPHSEFLRWDQDDRDKALAFHFRRKSECPHCHTRAEEWDPARGGDRHMYVADEVQCRGCEQMQAKRASLRGDERRGVHVVLRRNRNLGGDM